VGDEEGEGTRGFFFVVRLSWTQLDKCGRKKAREGRSKGKGTSLQLFFLRSPRPRVVGRRVSGVGQVRAVWLRQWRRHHPHPPAAARNWESPALPTGGIRRIGPNKHGWAQPNEPPPTDRADGLGAQPSGGPPCGVVVHWKARNDNSNLQQQSPNLHIIDHRAAQPNSGTPFF